MKPFTSSTAPRNGRVKGSRNKLSAQSMLILDRLLVDWAKHGAATLRTLRIERPELYAKLALDVASRVVLNDAADDSGAPMMLVVRWGAPRPGAPMPLPPETAHPTSSSSEPPPRGPMQMPRLLSFERPLDQ